MDGGRTRMDGRQTRFDIQVMRGVAVLAVVLFHAFPDALAAGYLGVDVFFVLSGFLITGIILRGLERRDFSFKAFYIRRAKRLLPASLTTLAATALLASIFLTRSQISDFAKQLLGSLAFAANFVLFSQTGYFDGAAETKPLLHIWSLSLEEQFYFVAPFLLWLTPLRARPWLLIAGITASLGLCIVLTTAPEMLLIGAKTGQKLAFFMLPARAWELLFGGICSWAMIRHPDLTVPRWLKVVALATIAVTCAIGFDAVHPRWDALIVVVATCLILLGRDGWLPRAPLLPIKALGDWSYSLYLIHWPLFCFAFVAWVQSPPMPAMIGLALLAIGLAWLQYRFVEQPFLGDWSGFRFSPMWGIGAASLAIVGFAALNLHVTSSTARQLQPVSGLDPSCDQRKGEWVDLPACRTSPSPTVAVWGDSYAMHWVPGLEGLPIVQLTKTSCAPVQGLSMISKKYSVAWARECVAFNDKALAAIKGMPSVHYVVIGSIFIQVLTDENSNMVLFDGRVEPFADQGREALIRTVKGLIAAGKQPIILAPTPRATFDAGRCNEREIERKPIWGHDRCDIPEQGARLASAKIDNILRQVAAETGAIVIFPADVLCRSGWCMTRDGDVLLYRDRGHLTAGGSRMLVERLGLRGMLEPKRD